jgi:hypothetical protein
LFIALARQPFRRHAKDCPRLNQAIWAAGRDSIQCKTDADFRFISMERRVTEKDEAYEALLFPGNHACDDVKLGSLFMLLAP